MRVSVVLCSALLALSAVSAVVAQAVNSPSTFNAVTQRNSADPCDGINVNYWNDVPLPRITTDPNFDGGIPADYASVYPVASLDNTRLYPNGFRKGQVYEDNNPPFCFKVRSPKNKQVQVMIETVDDLGRLCLKDTSNSQRMGGVIDRCFTDRHIACFPAATSDRDDADLTLLVYVDSRGATSATEFWYRVRVSDVTWTLSSAEDRANSAITTLEMWCMMLDQDVAMNRFPKDLRSEAKPEVVPAMWTAAATTNTQSIVTLVAAILATAAAIFRQ